jgi:integrase
MGHHCACRADDRPTVGCVRTDGAAPAGGRTTVEGRRWFLQCAVGLANRRGQMMHTPLVPLPRVDGLVAQIPAPLDDASMLKSWLVVFNTRSVHTARSYQREAYRFRFFLVSRHGEHPQLLARATEEDVLTYEELLLGKSTPNASFPYELGEPLRLRYGFKNQPFAAALKKSSVMQALSVLNAMYEYFRQPLPGNGDQYVRASPVSRVKTSTSAPRQKVRRILPEAAVLAMFDCASERSTDPAYATIDRQRYRRVLWIVRLLLSQWLRCEEASTLKMGDFFHSEKGWMIRLHRKGRKVQDIPVLKKTMDSFMVYRAGLGLADMPDRREKAHPAIRRIRGDPTLPVKPMLLYDEVRWIAEETVKWAEGKTTLSESERQSLAECSPHWFRHTGVSRALNAGKNVVLVSRMAGHNSVDTTTNMYFGEDTAVMRKEMDDADL